MKIIFNIGLILWSVLGTLETKCQTPDYFSNNPVWKVNVSYPPDWEVGYELIYYINGDSLLNGMVYPNPTTNVLSLEFPNRLLSSLGAHSQIIIRNSQGIQVFSETVSNSNPTASIDLNSNAPGIYLMSVVSKGKFLSSKRIILE